MLRLGPCLGNPGGGLFLGLLGGDSRGRDLVLGTGGDDTPVLLAGLELSAQVLVLTAQTTKLDDDLIQEVVNLVLVITTTELSRGEILVEDILGHERHVVTSVDFVRGGRTTLYQGAPKRASGYPTEARSVQDGSETS